MSRWLKLAVLAIAVTLFAPSGTTTLSAAMYTYDAPTAVRAGAQPFAPAEASPTQLSGLRERSASLSVEARGASTTFLSRNIATNTARPAGPGPRGGDSPAAARGRQAHADANYGPGFQNEFTLPSGRRVDGINFDTRTVVELKPNNPRAIRAGERQVSGYVDELNAEFPGSTPWTGRVETYVP
jgi:hypothetical protein